MSNLFGRHVAALCCLWLLSPAWTPAAAEAQDRPASGAEDSGSGDEEEDPGADDAFSFGEEDNQDSPAAPVTKPPPPSAWSLTGFLRSDWALWTERLDSTPLAKGRQSVDLALGFKKGIVRVLLTLHGEYDLAYLVDRGSHDEPTREAYEWQVNTREALVALSLGEFELTLGRQIVAWGEGDALSPLDVVNPRDMREPGLADLDDIRLPVLASRVGWFRGPHRVEVMMIHESDFGYRPQPYSPYSPFSALLGDNPMAATLLRGKTLSFDHRQDRFAFNQQQLLVRWVYKGAGIDLGLYVASALDQQGVVILDPATLAAQLTNDALFIELDHRRYELFGHSGAWPFGHFLLKWELDLRLGQAVNSGSIPAGGGIPTMGVEQATMIDTMVGLTWTGVQDLMVGLEIWKPWVVDGPDETLMDLGAAFFALRASYTMLGERLRLLAAMSVVGWSSYQGLLLRGEATYEIMDGLKVGLGYISYLPGGDDAFGFFYGLDQHDRLFLRLRWDFQAI